MGIYNTEYSFTSIFSSVSPVQHFRFVFMRAEFRTETEKLVDRPLRQCFKLVDYPLRLFNAFHVITSRQFLSVNLKDSGVTK